MKKISVFLIVVLAVVLTSFVVSAEKNFTFGTVYVSQTGNDANSGVNPEQPLKTIEAAYELFAERIILMDDTDYTDAPVSYEGNVVIEGNTEDVALSLNGTVNLKGNLKFDNLKFKTSSTFYANGYILEIGEAVTCDDETRLTVYGGKNSADLDGNTDIRLYGGKYNTIYGGCYKGAVYGNTNVILGGNANFGEGIDDEVGAANLTPCLVYGGSNSAAVYGKTNVTLEGNAVAKYVVGSGHGSGGTAVDTNINIKGGNVMSVFGGSRSVALTGCNTHVKMTGGIAESVFGGCESVSMSGSTNIELQGGEVTRRVYGGCYNNYDWYLIYGKWADTTNHVTGATYISVSDEVSLNTKNGLTGTNVYNVGVFSGSRIASHPSDEINTVIFLDGCYNSKKGVLGDKSGISALKSFENYTVDVGTGGKITGTAELGKVKISPDLGKYAVTGTTVCSGIFSLSSASTNITFADNFTAEGFEVKMGDSGAVAQAEFGVTNATNEEGITAVVAVYSGNKFIGTETAKITADSSSATFNIDKYMQNGGTYNVKMMLLDKNIKPLLGVQTTQISK